MKRIITFLILFVINIWSFAQFISDDVIGATWYDLQTWRAMQNRLYNFEDGTIGAVWNFGYDSPPYDNLGIGYNYFEGTEWGNYPSQSITSVPTLNPSYTAFLENGEICLSQTETGLIISYRENKGSGSWTEVLFNGTGLKHPVVVTTGVDNQIIHLLYLKTDESFNPTNAQPYRGFLWYARSSDMGQTWEVDMEIPGLGPENYLGFTIGSYCWAHPDGNTLAFLAGDYLTDLVLMKSNNGGDSWEKTVVWEHPYPMFEIFTFESDSFYCNDGGISLTLDDNQMAHLSFGLSLIYSTTQQDSIWYDPEIGGVVYWNENIEPFSNNLNALNPYGHPDSELIENYNLIAWLQDLNGNNQIETPDGYGIYPTPGLCTMTQIHCKPPGRIIVTYSSVTENSEFRHIWSRGSPDMGISWGNFIDLNADLIYLFDECVYPSVSPLSINGDILLTFESDGEPGLQSPEEPIENYIVFMKVMNFWNETGIQKKLKNDYFYVSPNPSNGIFKINFENAAINIVEVQVFDLLGTKMNISTISKINEHVYQLDLSGFPDGIYFVKIHADNDRLTKKLIVRR